MTGGDTNFTGSIPALYQQHLVPLLFRPWAELLAQRAAEERPATILETAAGTGVLTREMVRACPDATIVSTDLNDAMLDVARGEMVCPSLTYRPADACDLPFANGSFDLITSQFGIMFYPDRVKGYAEAVRVLAPGGVMIAAVWGSLEENPVSEAVQQAMDERFPHDPPRFLARTPFGYHDADLIIAEAEQGGFDLISVERVTLPHPALSATSAAEGLVLGSPLRGEIEERDPAGLDRALAATHRAFERVSDAEGRIDSTMTALVITARR